MVALYIRLSQLDDDLNDQQQSNSVEHQRVLLNEYLAEAPDLRHEDAEEFVDDGWSGMDFQRPAFQRMLALIKKRTVTTVVVKDFSRFGRNYVECADYLENLFPFLGTRFISVTDRYDSGRGEADRQMETAMKNIVNSYYSQDLSRKITSTFDMKRVRGEFFYSVPFGYLRDPMHRGKICVDEEAAAVVRRIFALACGGRRPSDIAKLLNREQIPTKAAYNRAHNIQGKTASREKSEHAAWTGSKVSSVLKNETYMGTYVTRRSRRAAAGAKRSVAVTDAKRIPNNHPALVSSADFEKAQEVFTRAGGRRAENRRYQLRSKVFCGSCGYAMAYSDNLYEDCYFYCAHTMQTGNRVGCPRSRFPEELLNAWVFDRLQQWMSLLETACGSAEEAEQRRLEGLRLLEQEARGLQTDLKERQQQQVALYERYRDGTLDREAFLEQKQQLTAEADSIRGELNRVHQREARMRKLRNRSKPELDDLLEQVQLFREEKRLTCTMAEAFVEKVTIYDKWHIEVIWKGEQLVEAVCGDAAEAQEGRGQNAL